MEATQPPTYEYKCNKHLQQTFNKKWEETNMKKKVLSALLTTAMLASMLVGCGSISVSCFSDVLIGNL